MEALCQVETCGKPVQSASICADCEDDLRSALGNLPALSEELDTTLTRQTALGERAGKARSATKPLPYDPRASEVSWVLRNTLVGWVRELDDGWPDDTVADMARFLLARVERLRTHPAGGEAVDEIVAVVSDAWRVVDRKPGSVFLAACDECDTDLYAKPWHTWTACTVCGAEYDIGERKSWMRDEIRDQLYHSAALSDVLRGVGVTVTSSMIRGYAKRGKIAAKTLDGEERPLYRVGDVLRAAGVQEAA